LESRLSYNLEDVSIGRLNPLLKLFLLIVILVGILIYPSWRLSFILLCLVISLFKITNTSLKLSRRRTRFIILFSLLLLVFQIMITSNGTVFGYIIPQFGNIGPFFPLTDYGIERGLSISLRFLIIVLSSMLFVSVTDPTLLAHSLTRLRIPFRYSFALVLALRFLPLFDSENQIVRLAQKSRGLEPELGGFHKILRTVQYTVFPLLVSSLSRIDTLSMSMDGRGFGYRNTRTYFRESKWHRLDTFILVFSIAYLLLCFFLALGFLPQLSAVI
jgi:energy-coupling factor transport system permease protein